MTSEMGLSSSRLTHHIDAAAMHVEMKCIGLHLGVRVQVTPPEWPCSNISLEGEYVQPYPEAHRSRCLLILKVQQVLSCHSEAQELRRQQVVQGLLG